jgi:hypothetical protein
VGLVAPEALLHGNGCGLDSPLGTYAEFLPSPGGYEIEKIWLVLAGQMGTNAGPGPYLGQLTIPGRIFATAPHIMSCPSRV